MKKTLIKPKKKTTHRAARRAEYLKVLSKKRLSQRKMGKLLRTDASNVNRRRQGYVTKGYLTGKGDLTPKGLADIESNDSKRQQPVDFSEKTTHKNVIGVRAERYQVSFSVLDYPADWRSGKGRLRKVGNHMPLTIRLPDGTSVDLFAKITGRNVRLHFTKFWAANSGDAGSIWLNVLIQACRKIERRLGCTLIKEGYLNGRVISGEIAHLKHILADNWSPETKRYIAMDPVDGKIRVLLDWSPGSKPELEPVHNLFQEDDSERWDDWQQDFTVAEKVFMPSDITAMQCRTAVLLQKSAEERLAQQRINTETNKANLATARNTENLAKLVSILFPVDNNGVKNHNTESKEDEAKPEYIG